jgi:eukaryotic-like serine/threonine-protein kinase
MSYPPTFSPEVLRLAEQRLAARIGPLARILVKRLAPEAGNERELYLRLADAIDDDSERATFIAEARLGESFQPVDSEPDSARLNGAVSNVLPDNLVRDAERDLARFLGPIARVLVKRAAQQATDRKHLYRLLALEINNPVERRRFLLSK